jgi:Ser/Thr protein kinase RdoA (MazF antagonist)
MTLFDFFQAEELPVPAITADQARDIALAHFGVDAEITPLGSQQDANFLLADADGEPIGVLKIANPAFSRVELEAQDAAAAYISAAEPGVRAATNIELPGHPAIAEFHAEDGTVLYGRIIAHLSGGTMSGDRYVTPTQAAALGTLAGRTCRALADFEHPGVDRILQWDLRYAQRTVELLSAHMTDAARREAVETATATAWSVLADLSEDLPVQVIHGDITDDNVVCGTLAGGRLPDGIIDLGDLTRSPSWPSPCPLCCATRAGSRPRRCPRWPPSTPYVRSRPLRSRHCGRWSCSARQCWWSAGSIRRASTRTTSTQPARWTSSGGFSNAPPRCPTR